MRNILYIDGHEAAVSFDQDIGLLRGEFLGLTGGADFYAGDAIGLIKEGRRSLKVFLDLCAEKDVEPYQRLSGV